MLIDGIHIPLTTPFTRHGALYLRKLAYNVGRYSLTPASGLVALTGEGAALSDEDTVAALQTIGKAAGPEKVLIASIARDSVRQTLAVATSASEAGFDAVLLSAPPQARHLAPSELAVFFNAVADACPLPVMLFSDASFSIPLPLLAELSRHGNVLGLYAAALTPSLYREIAAATAGAQQEAIVTAIFAPVTRRMLAAAGAGHLVSAASLAGGTATLVSPAQTALKTRTKKLPFQIMAAGDSTALLELLASGVAGAMPSLSPCAPQACYEVYAAFKDGDPALSAEKQQRLAEADTLIRHLGIAAVKFGCDLNGYFGGSVRLPRLPLDATHASAVDRTLSTLKS
jgi:dihydrodipicolinate synthase/N-acetylneuraminate lyase